MVPVSSLGGDRRTWYYMCSRRRRRPIDGEKCMMPMRRMDDVEDRVWHAVVEVIRKPDIIEAAMRKQRQTAKSIGQLADTVAGAEAKLKQFDDRCEKLADQYRHGLIPDSVWEKHLEAVRQDRPALVRRLEEARAGVSAVSSRQREVANVLDVLARLRTKLKGSPSMEARRELVQALIPGTGDNVVTMGKNGEIDVRVVVRSSDRTTSAAVTS